MCLLVNTKCTIFLIAELCFAWRTTSVTDHSAFPSERFAVLASEHIRVVYFGLKSGSHAPKDSRVGVCPPLALQRTSAAVVLLILALSAAVDRPSEGKRTLGRGANPGSHKTPSRMLRRPRIAVGSIHCQHPLSIAHEMSCCMGLQIRTSFSSCTFPPRWITPRASSSSRVIRVSRVCNLT